MEEKDDEMLFGDEADLVIAQRAANLEKLKDILIKSIEKKKEATMSKPLHLGIKGIENLITTNIRQGSIICLNGSTGSGMTIFALKFLHHGIVHEHENGIYISFDETKQSILATAKVFGMDFQKYEQEKKFLFIEYPYNEIPQFADKDSVIGDFIRSLNIKRLVIDPITPLTLGYDNELQKRKNLKNLFERLKSWGCNTLLLAEDIPQENIGKDIIVKLSDGLIQFNFKKIKGTKVRTIEIPKMRGTEHTYNTHEFIINKKEGIEILKKKIID